MKLRLTLASLLALTAAPAIALECEDGFRAFTHAVGEDCIPVDPQRIVTLQDQNGLLPLMELGVTPVGSLGHVQSDGTEIFRRMDGYDTSAVAWIGSYRGPIDPEAVAALEPDLIIASPWPADAAEMLGDIAPVVVIDMFNNPLDVALMQFADVVNKTDRADELQAEFLAKAEQVRTELGDALQTTTASVLTYDEEDQRFYPANATQALGLILGALDPLRPAGEQGLGADREYRSMETIGDHNADVMFQLVFDADDGGNSDSYQAFTSHPLVAALPVTQAGQVYALDGIAMVGSAWGKAMNGLDQVSAVMLDEGLNRDLVIE